MKIWLIQLARHYWKLVNPVAFIARNFISNVARIGVRANNCLDVGAGTVPYAAHLGRFLGVRDYVAMDVAPTDRCTLVGDGCALPFRDASFELVVSFDVVQHVANSRAMTDEVVRVLKPGGHYLFTFPFLYAECDFHDYHRWTMEGMSDELVRAGLEIVMEQRRGGLFFAATLGVNWFIQHMIPGARRSWRTERTMLGLLRAAFVMFLTVPTLALGWVGLLLDKLLPVRGCYMGGAVLARKSVHHVGMEPVL
ncbi:MAG: class I SAM-dependent methyltransferase [Sideroxydans sp.]|jgi:SAM-dependent methyltransferase